MTLPGICPKIAIATGEDHAINDKPPLADDVALKLALEKEIGQEGAVQVLNWRDGAVSWESFDAIFVSSTWDIPDHPADFLNWIHRCSQGRERLINDRQVILDNITKSRYLQYLIDQFAQDAQPGVAITPSAFYAAEADPGNHIQTVNNVSLDHLIDALIKKDPLWDSRGIVIKPIISADGKQTFLYNRANARFDNMANPALLLDQQAAQQAFDQLTQNTSTRGVILQPYIEGVEKGEYSLVFFHDDFSHAIKKPGGFLQTIASKREPVADGPELKAMIGFGKTILQHMRTKYGVRSLTRTRIDLFKNAGDYFLCELECTEPNINLARFPQSEQQEILGRFAKAIHNRALELMGKYLV